MDQQSLLDRDDRPELYFVIDEAALHRWVGGSAVMRNQLERLKQVSELPRVTLQVLPFRIGAHAGIQGPFQVLEFAEGDDYVLYIDDADGGVAIRDLEAETERYLTLFWDLEAAATKPWEFPDVADRCLATFEAE